MTERIRFSSQSGIIITSIILALFFSSPLMAARGKNQGRTVSERRPVNQAGAERSQEDTLLSYKMKEIVVTAKRTVVPVETLPLSVSLIASDRIDISTANSSTGIAGELPGVFIQRTGDFGRNDVSIRGLGSRGRKSLVLIDGKPEMMGLFGCTVTHSFLMHDVKRVEVIRGPSSTMFGSGAMGGVLNIIPERPSSNLELNIKTAGGSNQTAITSGRIGASHGAFFGSASVDYRESDGHTMNSSYRGSDIVARGGIYLGDNSELVASAKIFDGFKQEPSPLSVPSPGQGWNDYRRGSVDLHFRNEGMNLWYSTRYYRNFGEHEFSDGWHSRDATDAVVLHIAGNPVSWLEISGGADWHYQQGELPGQAGASWNKWDTGIYSGVEITPSAPVTFSAGARYNRDEVSGSELSPSVGITARPWKGGTVRGLVSHGFRSPQINELYMFPPSNTGLEAERVWNYEIGLKQKFPAGLHADLTAFRMEGENFIETVASPDPPPMYIFDNTGELEFNGLEFTLGGEWPAGIRARFSASLLDRGDKTRGRPGRKYDLSLIWNTGISTVRLTGQSVDEYFAADQSRNPVSSYSVFNLYADIDIAGGITAFAAVDNILDEEYTIFTDLPGGSAGLYSMPGRTLLGGLKYEL